MVTSNDDDARCWRRFFKLRMRTRFGDGVTFAGKFEEGARGPVIMKLDFS